MPSHFESSNNTSARKKASAFQQVQDNAAQLSKGPGKVIRDSSVNGKKIDDLASTLQSSIGNVTRATDSKISGLKEQLTHALGDNKNLTQKLQLLQGEVGSIKGLGGELNNLKNSIGGQVQAGNKPVSKSLTALQNEVNAIKQQALGGTNATTNLQNEVNAIKQQVGGTVSKSLTALQNEVNAVKKQALGGSKDTTSLLGKVEANVGTLQNEVNAVKQQALGGSKDADAQIQALKDENAKLKAEVANNKKSLHNDLQKALARIAGLEKKSGNLPKLHVGESVDIPEQPDSNKVSGVWKDAPLSLSVSGGLVLHDVGYTNKKGHALTLDPETHRVLVHHGK